MSGTGAARLRRWVPGVAVVRGYRARDLGRDAIAGLVLVTLLVPQGMAYAQLAGLPPINGLYTSIFCLIAYAVFGPSRILVLGPDSALGPMIAAAVLPLVGREDPAAAVPLAAVLALMVGALMAAAGMARFGFVADLLAKPTRIGYLNGLALTILIGRLPELFGFQVDAPGLLGELWATGRGLFTGAAVPLAAATGLLSLTLILVLGRWLPKLPAVLVTVVLAAALSWLLGAADHGVRVVGPLPQGFPPLVLPHAPWGDLPELFAAALGITLVALTDTISTATAFAAGAGQRVRPNQEMVGIGAANLAVSFFQGFPVSTSGSRSAVARQAGARTQLTGVAGAVCIALLLLFAPNLLRTLPQPTLAAVVMAAALSLADLSGARRLWRQRRMEFGVSAAAFLGVALLGVLPGIAVAVGLSVLNVFRRAWWPYQTVLGEVPGLAGYHDVHVHPDAHQLPGLVLFRFDAPLIFANARVFREQLLRLARTDPPPRWIVLAAEPVTDIDTTAADMLTDLAAGLAVTHTTLVFAELKTGVRTKLERYRLPDTPGSTTFYHTLDEAVTAFRSTQPR